jgi:hypothetical protein
MNFIMELPCKHQKYSEHFMVIYDISLYYPAFVTSV